MPLMKFFDRSTSPLAGSHSARRCSGARGLETLEERLVLSTLIKDITPGAGDTNARYLTEVNGTLYFGVFTSGLWKSDLTGSGTVRLGSLFDAHYLTNVNGTLFFQGSDANGNELWKSDGTAGGTVLVKDLVGGSLTPHRLANVSGTLFFTGFDAAGQRSLWKSDGTASGTVVVKQGVFSASTAVSGAYVDVNGAAFFMAATPGNGQGIWKSDGTSSGTVLVKDFGANTPVPNSLTNVNGTLFFRGGDAATGAELWKSDGTASGTVMVKDIQPGSGGGHPELLAANFKGNLYFTADDGVHGEQLWRSDGTASGTVMIKGVGVSPTAVANWGVAVAGNNLYFIGLSGDKPNQLWKTDGTDIGAVKVAEISSTDYVGLDNIVNVGGFLYFTVGYNGTVKRRDLWRSDGTTAGTTFVEPVRPDYGNRVYTAVVRQSALVLNEKDAAYGNELRVVYPPVGVFIAGPTDLVRGQSGAFTFTAAGFSPAQLAAGLTFSIDWDGDGSVDQVVAGDVNGSISASHAYGQPGDRTIRFSVADSNGTAIVGSPLAVRVVAWRLGQDLVDPTRTSLYWGGTDGADAYVFLPGLVMTQMENNQYFNSRFTFTGSYNGRIYAYGQGGADLLLADVTGVPVVFSGGDGDDVLVGSRFSDSLDGGAGNDILFGGSLATDMGDLLVGGSGDDLLVGWYGADSIHGGSGQDLVIGGALYFVDLPSAVFAIQAEWTSGRSYSEKVANLSGTGSGPRNNANYFLVPGSSAIDDNAADQLFGEDDQDWLIYDFSQDVASDKTADEIATGV